MGKINKYANLYDKNGNKIRSVKNVSKDDKHTKYLLTDISMEELESMIDNYPKDGDKEALDRLKMYLFNMYNTYGNPHEQELIERIKAEAEKKTSEQEVKQALEDVATALADGTKTDTEVSGEEQADVHDTDADGLHDDGHRMDRNDTIMDEYVDFEEIKEVA